MNDVLPGDSAAWQVLERVARETFAEYGYREIRLPLLERTELFKRSIGELTDIVEKEMYTFEDRGGESLTLRPEATAGIVRACISNGLLHNQRQKLWCMGPMFRYERPQKGRYRQFHQIDVEALGFAGPDVDAELIMMSARLWRRLGLGGVRLQPQLARHAGVAQAATAAELVEYFRRHEASLDEDSRRRLGGNPLRILDSKNPAMREIVAGAPLITDYLDAESAAHFAALRAQLDDAGIALPVNPRLVRGLDYYSRTVFEWVTSDLGSQDAVCSGGRYDGLVAQLGGEPAPAIGWALGEERIVELMRLQGRAGDDAAADVYLALAGAAAERAGLQLAEALRDALPGLRVETNCGGGSFKSQLKRADRSGARHAVILGDDELARGVATLKPLREDDGQRQVPLADWPPNWRRVMEARAAGRLERRRPARAGSDGVSRSGRPDRQRTRRTTAPLVERQLGLDHRRRGARPRRAGGWQYWQRHQVQSAELDQAGYLAVIEALGRRQRDEAAKQARPCASAGRLRPTRTRPIWRWPVRRSSARLRRGRTPARGRGQPLQGCGTAAGGADRLARVLIEQGKHDEALACSSGQGRRVRGPGARHPRRRLAAKGDAAGARKEYDAALAAAGPKPASTARSWN